MRILIVTPWFPSADAAESGVFVAREATALAAIHDVSVLHIDANSAPGAPLAVPNAQVSRIRLDRRNPRSVLAARARVQRMVAAADVVHTHALPGLLPWLVGRPGRPWVHTEHWSGLPAPETLTRGERVIRNLLRPVLNRPEVVIAECERLATAVRTSRRGRIEIVPCIVPATRAVVDPPRTNVLRIAAVGGLIPRKGPHLAVDAIKELRDRNVSAHLTWVGGGPLRAELDARIEREGLADIVTFSGPLRPDDVGRVLDSADIFILPTQGDNFCVVTAEALVHGRPIVSGANTGAVDYTPQSVGAFVRQQSGSAYADALLSVAERTRDVRAQQIADAVRERFRPETVAARLTTIYRELSH